MTPRVAHVAAFRPASPNGVHRFVSELVTRLPQSGYDCEIWHFVSSVDRPTRRAVGDLEVFDLPFGPRRPLNIFTLPTVSREWLDRRARVVDLIHLHSVFQAQNVVCSKLDRPYVITPHGGYSDAVVHGRGAIGKALWYRAWERRLLRGASAMHAVSAGEAVGLRLLATPETVVIPNAVDTGDMGDVPLRRDGPWLFVGRLAVVQKGLDLLLEAYAFAQGRAGRALPRLRLVGPDFRSGARTLRKLTLSLGVTDMVDLVGPLDSDDVRMELSNASLFVHTSRWDGMPFSVLEAMAAGRPVLVTPGTNLSNVVNSRNCGFVRDLDANAIADGLLQAASLSDSEFSGMCLAAWQTARSDFSWNRCTSEMSTLYTNVLSGRRA